MQGTADVVRQLRREGFELSFGYLQYLVREGLFGPPQERVGVVFVWSEPDIQRLRSVLVRRGRGPCNERGQRI